MSLLDVAFTSLLLMVSGAAADILSVETRPGECSTLILKPSVEVTLDAVHPASAR